MEGKRVRLIWLTAKRINLFSSPWLLNSREVTTPRERPWLKEERVERYHEEESNIYRVRYNCRDALIVQLCWSQVERQLAAFGDVRNREIILLCQKIIPLRESFNASVRRENLGFQNFKLQDRARCARMKRNMPVSATLTRATWRKSRPKYVFSCTSYYHRLLRSSSLHCALWQSSFIEA